MTDDGVGRLLVVSLHQAIAEELPQRLEFYEHWLSPMGLKEGRGGLAPLLAVLSFLRQEGESTYDRVMTLAARHSAEWHEADSASTIRLLRWMPRRLRARFALGRARRLLTAAFAPMSVTTSSRRGITTIAIRRSVFCSLREPWPWPTCRYVAGAIERVLAQHGLAAQVRVEGCAGQGRSECALAVTFDWAARAGTEVNA